MQQSSHRMYEIKNTGIDGKMCGYCPYCTNDGIVTLADVDAGNYAVPCPKCTLGKMREVETGWWGSLSNNQQAKIRFDNNLTVNSGICEDCSRRAGKTVVVAAFPCYACGLHGQQKLETQKSVSPPPAY